MKSIGNEKKFPSSWKKSQVRIKNIILILNIWEFMHLMFRIMTKMYLKLYFDINDKLTN